MNVTARRSIHIHSATETSVLIQTRKEYRWHTGYVRPDDIHSVMGQSRTLLFGDDPGPSDQYTATTASCNDRPLTSSKPERMDHRRKTKLLRKMIQIHGLGRSEARHYNLESRGSKAL